MNCDQCSSLLFSHRASDLRAHSDLIAHLSECFSCNQEAERLSEMDSKLSVVLSNVNESATLDSRVFSVLQSIRVESSANAWRSWLWIAIPATAALFVVAALRVVASHRADTLYQQIAMIASSPPSPEIANTDQQLLTNWCSRILPGAFPLPTHMNRVRFRSAASLKFENHQAIFLRMQNEQRASLLIVAGSLTSSLRSNLHEIRGVGSASHWTEGTKTYVLIFQGSQPEMLGYMKDMGIAF